MQWESWGSEDPLKQQINFVSHQIEALTGYTTEDWRKTKSKRAEEEQHRLKEEVIRVQAARLADLSTPLIPVTDEVLVMPLVGGVAKAVQLLGAEVVLTGIRPEVAQPLVALGADLQRIPTRATLQSAIAHALQRR